MEFSIFFYYNFSLFSSLSDLTKYTLGVTTICMYSLIFLITSSCNIPVEVKSYATGRTLLTTHLSASEDVTTQFNLCKVAFSNSFQEPVIPNVRILVFRTWIAWTTVSATWPYRPRGPLHTAVAIRCVLWKRNSKLWSWSNLFLRYPTRFR